MLLETLKYIKNVDDHDPSRVWAYQDWKKDTEDYLYWGSGGQDRKTNADKPDKEELILLVQRSTHVTSLEEASITHLVEVIGDSSEQIGTGDWAIARKVRVVWAANLEPGFEQFIPREPDILGWKRQRNQGPNVIEIQNIQNGKVPEIWHSMEIFQRHVAGVLGLI